ncbi:MAG TPA: Eco57I restriction-modification methylase domain-containing protein [Dissulfurispiraceae bacterium]|nr:Eco57I restriction-modification methylase domain-containing protein [Dissulfurispiraceae bacterium]
MSSSSGYNPDVLSCIANLSSDEVFTPPQLVNKILDMLPEKLWSDKKATFLDPGCKSGVFLREIAKRLDKGLEDQIPDRQRRMNHIFKNQIYGIAITELTALLSRRSVYCSKTANGKYSVCETFGNPEGNIRFQRIEHAWQNGRCVYCGANKENYERGGELESHAYAFIHTDKPEGIFNMKFDVIIGNPPYQLSDAGFGRSASPIYQNFVQQARKLNPRFLTMIIPARWFAGGKGLDEFRSEMLSDKRIRKIVDFENSSDVFPGVDIAGGVCFFLWNRDEPGKCEVTNYHNGEIIVSERWLNEFPTFIRHSKAVPIIRKVMAKKENGGKYLSERVSSRKPFGLPTNYTPKNSGVPCWFIQKIGLKYASEADISDNANLLNKWKLLIPPAPIAGQTDFSKPVGFYYEGNIRIATPGECCTESWLVAGAFSTKAEVVSYKSYLFTKIVRFLLLQSVVSQHVTKDKFCFIPDLGKYSGQYSDSMLRKRWNISDDEWAFIDSKISNVEVRNE